MLRQAQRPFIDSLQFAETIVFIYYYLQSRPTLLFYNSAVLLSPRWFLFRKNPTINQLLVEMLFIFDCVSTDLTLYFDCELDCAVKLCLTLYYGQIDFMFRLYVSRSLRLSVSTLFFILCFGFEFDFMFRPTWYYVSTLSSTIGPPRLDFQSNSDMFDPPQSKHISQTSARGKYLYTYFNISTMPQLTFRPPRIIFSSIPRLNFRPSRGIFFNHCD